MPAVSIVTPVYNAAGYIAETIRMVEAQAFADYEMILVDDVSSDDSVRVMEETIAALPEESRKKYVILRQGKNGGAARARNRGVWEARGAYLAFLDADDVWLPGKLERQLAFAKEKNAAFSYHSYEFGDEEAKGTGKIVRALPELTYGKALSRTIIFTSTVLFDLSKITKEEIRMPEIESEDTATWWRVLRNGYKAYGLDEVLTIYRRPKQSLSSDKGKAIRRIWRLYREEEKLPLVKAAACFAGWAFRATARRL